MTPSFIGLMATMLPGVRPSMSFASLPTASMRPLTLLIATMEGSLTTMPLPRAYTQVFAVPRSMARSLENRENRERRLNIDYLYRNARLCQECHDCQEGSIGGRIFRNAGHPAAVGIPGMTVGSGHVHAVLPALLDPVHGFVRGVNQLLGGRGNVGKGGDSDRDCQPDLEAPLLQELVNRDLVPDARADHFGALGAGIREHQREFVAAEPGDDIRFTRADPDHGRRLDERRAPGGGAVRVGDRLEPVQIDEEQRQGPAASRRALGLATEHLREISRVVELGEVVGHRQRFGPLYP